jgi:N-acetylmuramoyl-L-alanine amidase
MSLAPFKSLLALALAVAFTVAPAHAATPTANPPAPLPPTAIAVETRSEAGKTRLTFTLSKPVEVQTFVLERPDRVVIEFPEVNFQLPPEAGRKREGLVASFRYGLFAAGRSRVVIDLVQPATVSLVEVTPRRSDGAVLVTVELARTDRDTFRRATKPQEPAGTGAFHSVGTSAISDRRPSIVIDAGHGGVDPGATASTGALEKDIVFEFAQQLRQRLEASGRYRVAMTRDHDVFIPLRERVRIAQGAKADLFISIHADSISAAPNIRGGTVYTGAESATDAESASLAERENKADAAAGHDTGDTPVEVADILQDLMLRETRGLSHRFAKKLLGAIKPVMPLSKKPHREAGFRVLRAPDVPSVLVELGYLSSQKDVTLLTSPEWRDRSTKAIMTAIDLYFGPRLADRDAAAVSP